MRRADLIAEVERLAAAVARLAAEVEQLSGGGQSPRPKSTARKGRDDGASSD